MPQFRTSGQLFKHSDFDDFWEEKFMEGFNVYLPPTYKWDYKKELTIEEVELWELIYEEGGLCGLYASYIPHAEFYLLLTKDFEKQLPIIKTFYGKNCLKQIKAEIKSQKLNWPIFVNEVWVDNEDMWLYENNTNI